MPSGDDPTFRFRETMRQPPAQTSLSHQAPRVYDYVDGPIRVRATRRGFYGHALREVGDVFGIHKKKDLGSWMELVTDEESVAAPDKGATKTDPPAKGSGGKGKDDVL